MIKSRESHMPIAFITGASSGFGQLAAVALARQGFTVIATMRNLAKQEPLLQLAKQADVIDRIECMELDVTDSRQIGHAVDEVIRRHQRIDVLVNNAGLALGGMVEEIPLENWREQMETNFFGLVAMTQAVLPHMRARRSGKIINVSSISGRIGFPGLAPYAASKFAIEGFSESLRMELLPHGIHVALVEPGSYKTNIWSNGIERLSVRDAKDDHSPYRQQLEAILAYTRQTADQAGDPQEVAAVIAKIAQTKSPKLRYLIGRGTRISAWGKAILPWSWFERIVLRQLGK